MKTDAIAEPGAGATTPVEIPHDLVPVVEKLIAGRAVRLVADYAAPPRHGRPLATVGLLGVFLIVAGFLHFCCAFLIPRFEAIYAAFGAKLPSITIAAIQFDHWINHSHGWVALWLAAVTIPMLITRLRDWPPPEKAREGVMLLLLLAFLLCLLMLAVLAALVLPFVTIGTSISAG